MSGRINLSNLSDSLKEHLNGLGLNEEQVNAIVQEAIAVVNAKDLSQDEAMESIQSSVDKAQSEVDAVELEVDDLQEFVNGHSHATIEQNITNLQNAVNGKADQSSVNKVQGEVDAVELEVDALQEFVNGHSHTTIEQNITNLQNAVNGKADKSALDKSVSDIGVLSNLSTSERSSLVGATNEIYDMIYSLAAKFSNVKQVACGLYHTFILKNDGSLWSCGWNRYGELGLGDTTKRNTFTQVTTNINNDVKEVVCNDDYTFILKNDGSVWACGYNTEGQLGVGDTTYRATFTKVITNINNDIKQIACGQNHAFILKNDGSVYSCGKNDRGQLGLNQGTTYKTTGFTKVTTNVNNDVKQIACGNSHTFILKNDGSVWACGLNANGQLGLGTADADAHTTFTKVTTNINNDVKQIVCGNSFTYLIKNDGSVWACGLNVNGQLGLGNISDKDEFTKVTTNVSDVKQIACDRNYTFMLKNDGSVWSCGYNYYGQLGLGDTTARNTFTQVTTNVNNDVNQIACGEYHVFILKNDGSVGCCGYNNRGQLGLGDKAKSSYSNIEKINPLTIF